jgi:hypothetical protein
MRPKLPLPAWLLLCACACAQAHALNQCRGQGGASAYREGDCLPGEHFVARHDAVPDPDPPADARQASSRAAALPSTTRRTQRAFPTRRSARGTARAHPKPRKASIDPCIREQRARDDFQRRRSIHVTMAELSRWNHRVYEACK